MNRYKYFLIAILFLIVAGISITIGRHQSEEWSITSVHHKQSLNGYNYCPYCGHKLYEGE